MQKKVIGFAGSLAVALALGGVGLIYNARTLLAAAAILAAAVVAAWLFFWAHPLPVPVSGTDARELEAERALRDRRRIIIDNARVMVTTHELQARRNWWETIRYSPEYAAVRPHLSADYLAYEAAPITKRTANAGSGSQPPVPRFNAELDRLEREWGLS